MVALKQEWCNEILMINIALFCLKKTDILANPVEQILSGDSLNGIQTIINNDLQTQREIAALVYGVDVEDARQIPLKKYIAVSYTHLCEKILNFIPLKSSTL